MPETQLTTAIVTEPGRLDAVLPVLGLARSRSQAAELIRAERVRVNGGVVTRASQKVAVGETVTVLIDPWVSRAAYKLLGALEESGIKVPSRVLDAGASTGGFTQVLLASGAKTVFAVDVGHDQLAPVIRNDERVVVREGLNLRDLRLTDLDGQQVDLAVADVSFISLRLILAPILAVIRDDGAALLMIKPQFEVGKQKLGAGGVVRNKADRQIAIDGVLAAAAQLGWFPTWQADSTLPGPAGNVEHFVALRRSTEAVAGSNQVGWRA